MIKSYRELRRLKTFEERYRYLRLFGVVGEATFGYDRCLNQMLYTSKRWGKSRDEVIIRDKGCDLGIEGHEIYNRILIHHMNPITIEDVEMDRDYVYDPEYLICTVLNTHNAIHYGDESLLPKPLIERRQNDTCPWR
jgi:hypothetical protein